MGAETPGPDEASGLTVQIDEQPENIKEMIYKTVKLDGAQEKLPFAFYRFARCGICPFLWPLLKSPFVAKISQTLVILDHFKLF